MGEALAHWLDSLTLKKFSASRNLVIDIDPAFPWQLTALDGYGANLGLVQNHQWGFGAVAPRSTPRPPRLTAPTYAALR